MKVKICGITNIEDAKLSCELGADALGFIFYNKSKRYIEPQNANSIIQKLPPFILKIGVFVNENPEAVNEIVKNIKLNMVQLHGDESLEYICKITAPIIKSFQVSDNFNFEYLKKFQDYPILLDSYSTSEFGGTGSKFNWKTIPADLKSKIILAGGVSIRNIKQIYNEIKPYAVDISSSIESEPGKKDHKKLKELFNQLQKLERK